MRKAIRFDAEDGYYVVKVDENWLKENVDGPNSKVDYFVYVKEAYRSPGEERISPYYKNRSDAIRYSCNEYFQSYVPDEASIKRHKEYAGKNLNDYRSLYICHNCQIIMWHSMIYCFGCPNKIVPSKMTNRELIELYDKGYKIGW